MLHDPTGVAVHPSGQIFVVDRGRHCIRLFKQDCTYSHSFGEQGNEPGKFCYPHSIAFDSKGNVYITDTQNHRIQKFAVESTLITVFDTRLEQPTALCIDPYDTLLIADVGNKHLVAYCTSDEIRETAPYHNTTMSNPCCMAVSRKNGYLFVADCSTNVVCMIH